MQKEQIIKNVSIVFDAAYKSNLLQMEEIPAVIETKQNIFALIDAYDKQFAELDEIKKQVELKDKRIDELEKDNEILKLVDEAKDPNNKKVKEMNVVTDEDGSEEDEEEAEEDEEEQAEEEQADSVANSDIPEASKKLDKIKSIKKANASGKR